VAGHESLALNGDGDPYPVTAQRRQPHSECKSAGGPTPVGVAAVERSRPLARDTRLESLR
jgi:hypothetical protein